jgi:lactase-phlorizin hydrolase
MLQLGWFAHPIYSKDGDYPQVMKDRIANLSRAEGVTQSRLPSFTAEEIQYIKGEVTLVTSHTY